MFNTRQVEVIKLRLKIVDFGWPNMFRQQIYRTERNKWPEEKVTVENKDTAKIGI